MLGKRSVGVLQDHYRTQDQDEQRQDDECIGPVKGEANNPHKSVPSRLCRAGERQSAIASFQIGGHPFMQCWHFGYWLWIHPRVLRLTIVVNTKYA